MLEDHEQLEAGVHSLEDQVCQCLLGTTVFQARVVDDRSLKLRCHSASFRCQQCATLPTGPTDLFGDVDPNIDHVADAEDCCPDFEKKRSRMAFSGEAVVLRDLFWA